MQVIEVRTQFAYVRLSKEELFTLNNALNEVCHGIDIPEFSTRIGVTLQEVKELLKEISTLIESMGQ